MNFSNGIVIFDSELCDNLGILDLSILVKEIDEIANTNQFVFFSKTTNILAKNRLRGLPLDRNVHDIPSNDIKRIIQTLKSSYKKPILLLTNNHKYIVDAMKELSEQDIIANFNDHIIPYKSNPKLKQRVSAYLENNISNNLKEPAKKLFDLINGEVKGVDTPKAPTAVADEPVVSTDPMSEENRFVQRPQSNLGFKETVHQRPKEIVDLSTVKIDKTLKPLGRGTEGIVYQTSHPDYVIKVLNDNDENTLQRMKDLVDLGKKVNKNPNSNILFPLQIRKGTEVHIVMKRARGKNLRCSINFFKQNFPTWKMPQIFGIFIRIIQQFKILHENNIIVGDLREDDIFISMDGTVEFCDTSSYQFGKYKCDLFSPDFRSPKYIDSDPDTVRTFEDDCYVLTVLFFKILMNDKTPYYNLGDEETDEIKNIKNKNFPYPLIEHPINSFPQFISKQLYITWIRLNLDIRKWMYFSFKHFNIFSLDDMIKLFSQQIYRGE